MNKLGLLDQAIFKSEQVGMPPMYMGTAMIVDPATAPEPLDGTMLANHLAACLEEVPLMRQKLVQDELRLGNMLIVDDPEFDVNNHVQIVEFEEPAGYDELTDYLGTFAMRRLDFNRPLWHLEVIEGLEHGYIAVAMHIHHSIMDGVGAQTAIASIWSGKPIPARSPRTEAWHARPEPHALQLVGSALVDNVKRLVVDTPTFLVKNSRPILHNLNNLISERLQLQRDEEIVSGESLPHVHKTSLNEPRLSDKRAVAYVELPIKDIKAMRTHYNCTVNDLALFINSWALDHYFREIGETIDFDLLSAMPLNTRAEGDNSAGNHMHVARINLHNTISDPEDRLKAIAKDTVELKRAVHEQGQRANTESPKIDYGTMSSLLSPIVLEALIFGVSRFNLMEKSITVNTSITNVPGSLKPAYMAGARHVSTVPMAPPFNSIGLNIAITSVEDLLLIGYHGCGEAIKDKELFVEGARAGLAALQSRSKPKTKAKTKPKAKTKSKPRANKAKKNS